MDSQHFIVNRDDLSEHDTVTLPRAPLAPDTLELAVDRFGFTAYNLCYATGRSLDYWRAFPSPRSGWGRIPVWGFVTVARSTVRAVPVGERLFGYCPMSSHFVVQPKRSDDWGFYDVAPHRRSLNGVYNRYLRTARDPHYRPDAELAQVVLRPPFATSYFVADYLRETKFFAADTVLVSSASSKLALGLAFMLAAHRRRGRWQLVGLTSARNLGCVARLGLYDRVVAYDDLTALPVARRALLVDIAGGADVRGAVHRQLGGGLTHLIAVGSTHGPRECSGEDLPGTEPIEFFSPAWMRYRSGEWTNNGAHERLADAWHTFLGSLREASSPWMTIASCVGPEEVARVYDDVIGNRARPELGHVLSL